MKPIVRTLICLALGVCLIAASAIGLSRCSAEKEFSFRLNERDVCIDVDGTVQLEIVPDQGCEDCNVNVSWVSSDSSVATVDKNGLVTGVAGGETVIKSIVKCNGTEKVKTCVVTVKDEGIETSVYRVRYYTQKQNRSGYDVIEKTYERIIGSKVTLSADDAVELLPEYYTWNQDRSILTGIVMESPNGCILDIYYDVSEVNYYVDYYYESADRLGTYELGKTIQMTDWAFSKVSAGTADKTGFRMDAENKNALQTVESVTEGVRLKVYYNRIRTSVTVNYCSTKKDAVYTNVYGVGLVDAPAGALSDNIAPYVADCYFNGVKTDNVKDKLVHLQQDATVSFSVSGYGYTYHTDDSEWGSGKVEIPGTLVSTNGEVGKASYTYLQGSGSTMYLSATYNLTGSQSDCVGITIKAGGEERQVYFSWEGVMVQKDFAYVSGIDADNVDSMYEYNVLRDDGYVFAQLRSETDSTTYHSAIRSMLEKKTASSHAVEWAIWNGKLYCQVDGEFSIAIPLSKFVESWSADTKYQLGIANFDGLAKDDTFSVQNIVFCTNDEALAKLNVDACMNDKLDIAYMEFEPFTGAYFTFSRGVCEYLYGPKTTQNVGITGQIQWESQYNGYAAAGVTVEVGSKSYQYVFDTRNGSGRRQEDHDYTGVVTLSPRQILWNTLPFDGEGKRTMGAYVKDGYFYITFDGTEMFCINMVSMFPDYTPDSEVRVGLYVYDANGGAAKISDIQLLDKTAVEKADLEEWGFYSNKFGNQDYGNSGFTYDFSEGSFTKLDTVKSWQRVTLYGSSTAWQVTGTMNRADALNAGDLMMGFEISANGTTLSVYGYENGFMTLLNNNWGTRKNYNTVGSNYQFGDISHNFFKSTRSTSEVEFKLLVYQDVLYVWFDGTLNWRIPLTDSAFGSFPGGSEYSVKLVIGDNRHPASMENIQVKMGYQVTGQTNVDVSKIPDTVLGNMDRWVEKSALYYMGEYADGFRGNGKVGYAYLTGQAGSQAISARINMSNSASDSVSYGFTLKTDDESVQIYLNRAANKLLVQYDNAASCDPVAVDLPDNYQLFDENGECTVQAVIKDGVLYLFHNDNKFGCVEMRKLFQNYDKDSTVVSLGIYLQNTTSTTGVIDQITYMNQSQAEKINVSNFEILDSVGRLKFYVGSNTDHVTYDALKGTVTIDGIADLMDRLLFAHDDFGNNPESYAEQWLITGTIGKTDATVGFSVMNTSGKVVDFRIDNGSLLVSVNGEWTSITDNAVWCANNAVAGFLSENGSDMKFKLILKDDVLQVYYGDTLTWNIPLTDSRFGSFAKGSQYQVGINATGAYMAAWTDLEVETVKGKKFEIDSTSSNKVTADEFNGMITIAGRKDIVDWAYIKANTDSGYSDAWRMTGTITRTGGGIVGFSVKDSSGKTKSFCIGSNDTLWINASYPWTKITPEAGANVWRSSTNVANFIKNAKSSMNYELIIWKDVLYVSFNGELTWQIPLTETTYGGFAAGSAYQVGINSVDPYTTTWSNIFISNEISEADVPAGWAFSINTSSYATCDGDNGTVKLGWYGGALFNGSANAIELSGNLSHEAITKNFFSYGGFVIKGADGKIIRLFGVKGDFKYDNGSSNGTAFGWNSYKSASTYLIDTPADSILAVSTATTQEVPFKFVVANDYCYIWLQNKLVFMAPLNKLNTGWTAGQKVSIGVIAWDNGVNNGGTNGKVIFDDLCIRRDDEIKVGFLDTLAWAVDKNWKAVYEYRTLTADGYVKNLKTTGGGNNNLPSTRFSKYICLSEIWERPSDNTKGKMTYTGIMLSDADGNGVRVFVGDSCVVKLTKLYGWTTQTPYKNTSSYIKNATVLHNLATSAVGVKHSVLWEYADGNLSLTIDGTLAAQFPISTLYSTWTADTELSMGIAQWDAKNNGWELRSNIKVTYDEKKNALI